MNKQRCLFAVLAILLFLFCGAIGLFVFLNDIDKQTSNTTTPYTATVKKIAIIDTGKNISAEIHTKEYDTTFLVTANICKYINTEELKALEENQSVFFSIQNKKAEQVNSVALVDIVSLKTNTKDIFTLEQYNAFMQKSAYPARIASVIMAGLFLCIFLYLCRNISKTDSASS